MSNQGQRANGPYGLQQVSIFNLDKSDAQVELTYVLQEKEKIRNSLQDLTSDLWISHPRPLLELYVISEFIINGNIVSKKKILH